MAGHSKFKNIMHRKGRQDSLRAKKFTKLTKEIESSARISGDNPAFNPRLRLAINMARSLNLPKERIDNAIKNATTEKDDSYEEICYEAYAPGGVAIIIEALTDNRNRTASDIRSYFTKAGGVLGETNSVNFMFDKIGQIKYPLDIGKEEEILMKILDIGIDNFYLENEHYILEISFKSFNKAKEKIIEILGQPEDWEIKWKPQNYIEVSDIVKAGKISKLIESLEENNDVQSISSNHIFSEDIIKKMEND